MYEPPTTPGYPLHLINVVHSLIGLIAASRTSGGSLFLKTPCLVRRTCTQAFSCCSISLQAAASISPSFWKWRKSLIKGGEEDVVRCIDHSWVLFHKWNFSLETQRLGRDPCTSVHAMQPLMHNHTWLQPSGLNWPNRERDMYAIYLTLNGIYTWYPTGVTYYHPASMSQNPETFQVEFGFIETTSQCYWKHII